MYVFEEQWQIGTVSALVELSEFELVAIGLFNVVGNSKLSTRAFLAVFIACLWNESIWSGVVVEYFFL